jgi:uncharacterized membrane protein YhdT
MNDQTSERANRLMGLTLVYGFLLAAFYVLAAFKAGTIMGYLSASDWYAVAGAGVAAIFLHVAFAMSLFSTLRVRAERQRAEKGAVAMKKRTAQRARPRAYINPWHNV